MAPNHKAIIAVSRSLRVHQAAIVAKAKAASKDVGDVEDNKPSARVVANLDAEILRLRALYLADHVAFLAAIDE